MFETHRDLVEQAHCDGNGHLNVSQYVRLFSTAGQNFLTKYGASALRYSPQNRHFRFHKEVLEHSRVAILSIRLGKNGQMTQSQGGSILHVLQNLDRAEIAATCLDSDFAIMWDKLPTTEGGAPVKAMPRSLSPERFDIANVGHLLDNKLALLAHQNRVTAQECGSAGHMDDHHMVGKFFGAANHLWPWAGFEPQWFKENQYGVAALEMKLTYHGPIRCGDDYAIVSWVPHLGGKMVPLSHQLVTQGAHRPIASICANSVVLDHNTRLSVDIPEKIRDRHFARFSELRDASPY